MLPDPSALQTSSPEASASFPIDHEHQNPTPKKRHGTHDLQAELLDMFGTKDGLEEIIKTYDIRHFRPIEPDLRYEYENAEYLWKTVVPFIYDSEEVANESLKRGAPFPELYVFKTFLSCVAEDSDDPNPEWEYQGWTVEAFRKFVTVVFDLFARAGVQDPTDRDQQQVSVYIRIMQITDKALRLFRDLVSRN